MKLGVGITLIGALEHTSCWVWGITLIGAINSLVPRQPHFHLPFAFTIIHRNERPAKTGKGWEHSSHEWRRGGHREGGADIQIFKG